MLLSVKPDPVATENICWCCCSCWFDELFFSILPWLPVLFWLFCSTASIRFESLQVDDEVEDELDELEDSIADCGDASVILLDTLFGPSDSVIRTRLELLLSVLTFEATTDDQEVAVVEPLDPFELVSDPLLVWFF